MVKFAAWKCLWQMTLQKCNDIWEIQYVVSTSKHTIIIFFKYCTELGFQIDNTYSLLRLIYIFEVLHYKNAHDNLYKHWNLPLST